jgi:hypothetical protein
MNVLRRLFTASFLALAFFMPFAVPVRAQATVDEGYTAIMSEGLIFANICENRSSSTSTQKSCACRDTGDCSLSDVLQIFVNISIAILGICGSVALLVFMYGGVVWVTAMGEAKKIALGKDILTKAVMGLAIIFGSYAFINFIIAGLAGDIDNSAPGTKLEDTINNASDTDSKDAPDIIDSR